MESKDLLHVYKLICHEVKKAEHRIDWIDGILANCDKVSSEYWRDERAKTIAYLNGLSTAADIVWKELYR